jgi:uncharacterized protein (TIGR00369 family)
VTETNRSDGLVSDAAILQRLQQKMTVPLFRDLDFALTAAGEGWAEITLNVAPRHFNPNGVLHGGMWTMIADSAMAAAIHSMIAPDEMSATMQLDIRWLRPAPGDRLRVVGRVLRRGRRAWHTTAELFDGQGRSVGIANAMFAILSADDRMPPD